MSYTTLQADIASYLHHTGLTAKIPGFIALAEPSLFRELNIKAIQTSVTGATVGGYVVLPDDFGSLVRLSIIANSLERNLDYIGRGVESTAVNTSPNYYSFENDKLRIIGAGDGQAYTLYYIPNILPLSDSVATNWLLDNAPDLYLYASALEGAKYIRDTAQAAILENMVKGLLQSVRSAAESRGQPLSGSLQIKPRR